MSQAALEFRIDQNLRKTYQHLYMYNLTRSTVISHFACIERPRNQHPSCRLWCMDAACDVLQTARLDDSFHCGSDDRLLSRRIGHIGHPLAQDPPHL